jgi:capsular exopolysaccharide synthesis family protein
MENDQRLTPLPVTTELQPTQIDYPFHYSPSYDDSFESKRSIKQYVNIVIKRLPIILGITVLVTAAAAIYSYRQPSIFQAQTAIIIEPRKPEVTRKDVININFGNDQTYYATQLKLLQSHDLMKRVVISLGLHREANLFASQGTGIWTAIKGLFGGSQQPEENAGMLPVVSDDGTDAARAGEIQLSPEESRRADMYAARLVGGLRVEQVERTNLVNISVTSTEPAIAAKVSDKVAELFIKEDIERETSGALKAYEDLANSIEDLKATIIKQENDYIEEMRSANLPLQERGGDLRAGNLEALLAQWREAYNDANKMQTLYTAALTASGKGDILSVVGDNKAIQDARSQNLKRKADLEKRIEDMDKKINEAKERRETLLAKYTPEYRDVLAVDAQIRELETQKEAVVREVTSKITDEGKKLEADAEREVMASLRAQLYAAQQRESRARGAFESAASKANFEGQVETKLIGSKREIDTNRSLLDTYIQRQKEQELAIASGRPDNIKIQSNAVTPTSPIGPQRTQNILVAMLIAFAAGVGLAFLLDYLDDSVKSSDDISRHLGLPTLALIPHQFANEKRKLLQSKNSAAAVQGSALITLDDRNSPMAEAYRHLRTSLLFSSAGKPPQTILVTSAQPSEGKTTTAINTAIPLAQADADVIIIDCDLRRPRLHNHFGLENSRGITNYLSGDRDLESIVRTYPDIPRLKVITSGPIPPNPAELLSSNEMRHLLEELSAKYKHVIIDSPPAISFTDAAIISTLVDGVVLVAMANKSSMHLMRQFKQRVHNMGARIYGVVLNGIRAGSVEYDYYGSGYYHYYSRSSEDTSTPYMDDERS